MKKVLVGFLSRTAAQYVYCPETAQSAQKQKRYKINLSFLELW